jgi:Putative bacterial sensory transduction regulator
MTELPALAERIHGILVRAHIGFTPSQDGLEFFVPIRDGTAAVMVRPGEFGDEPLVVFQSPVLQGVPFEEAGARALAAVNLRNCGLIIGRLAYYEADGVIALEYAILARNLQAQELIRALQIVAAYADTLDDDLLLELGVGQRARDVWGTPQPGDAGAA